jgi:hypothetical protein
MLLSDPQMAIPDVWHALTFSLAFSSWLVNLLILSSFAWDRGLWLHVAHAFLLELFFLNRAAPTPSALTFLHYVHVVFSMNWALKIAVSLLEPLM